MNTTIIDNVVIFYDEQMSMDEVVHYLAEEEQIWKNSGKELARVEMTLDGDCVVIKGVERSPVRRVRRITGCLSNMENFNDAKQDELAARKAHGLPGRCGCD